MPRRAGHVNAAVLAAALAGCLLPGAAGAAYPRITGIAITGNATTQDAVLLREMLVHVGDPADPALIERSRQAIQDLRLFRSVALDEVLSGDGVRLLVTVREKYYVLPLPRASANSDGQYSYGVGLRWWNLWGLNHTLHLVAEQGSRQEEDRGKYLQFQASYDVPLLLDSPYGLSLSFGHSEEPVESGTPIDEVKDSARVLVSRALGGGPASQGWRVGGGLQWQNQPPSGPLGVPAVGQSTALVLFTRYDDMHFNVYSDQGLRFSVEGQSTVGHLASDYGYNQFLGSYEQSWKLGETPHQTFGVFGEAGVHDGGAPGTPPVFSLGGSENLRGYDLHTDRGNAYYYGGIEFLRPLHWDWLRAVAFVEAGDVVGEGSDPLANGPYTDVGIGLRLRLNWFVRTELNFGLAYPLVDSGEGRSPRIYASGYR